MDILVCFRICIGLIGPAILILAKLSGTKVIGIPVYFVLLRDIGLLLRDIGPAILI